MTIRWAGCRPNGYTMTTTLTFDLLLLYSLLSWDVGSLHLGDGIRLGLAVPNPLLTKQIQNTIISLQILILLSQITRIMFFSSRHFFLEEEAGHYYLLFCNFVLLFFQDGCHTNYMYEDWPSLFIHRYCAM